MDANIPSPSPEKNQVSDADVMGQLKKETGPAQKMSVQDIIKTEFENNSSGIPWEKAYAYIQNQVKDPKFRLLRANNSVFMIRNNGDHTAYIFMFNADKVSDMPKSMKEFADAMKKAGFTKGQFDTPRPAVVGLLKKSGLKFTSSQTDFNGKPSIHVEVEF